MRNGFQSFCRYVHNVSSITASHLVVHTRLPDPVVYTRLPDPSPLLHSSNACKATARKLCHFHRWSGPESAGLVHLVCILRRKGISVEEAAARLGKDVSSAQRDPALGGRRSISVPRTLASADIAYSPKASSARKSRHAELGEQPAQPAQHSRHAHRSHRDEHHSHRSDHHSDRGSSRDWEAGSQNSAATCHQPSSESAAALVPRQSLIAAAMAGAAHQSPMRLHRSLKYQSPPITDRSSQWRQRWVLK